MIKKLLILSSWLLVAVQAFAGERVALWPEGKIPDCQTQQIAATTQEVKAPGFKTAEHTMPHLDWYEAPAAKNGGCMLLISGGGYQSCCDGMWIDRAAKKFTELGFVCVSLTYRTPRPQGLPIYQSAWEDGQRAVRLVRNDALKRGFDPEKIGAFGFSAGSHLTVLLATSALTPAYGPIDELDKLSCNVQWAVAIYPAYALTDGAEAPNAKGGNEDDARLVPEFSFDLATCPILFLHGDADGWAAMNSVKCWEQLRRMEIQSDLHTLVGRMHCFQRKAAPGTGSYTWMDRIWEFMNHKGFNK